MKILGKDVGDIGQVHEEESFNMNLKEGQVFRQVFMWRGQNPKGMKQTIGIKIQK